MEVELGPTYSEESEAKLKAAVGRMRERAEIAEAEAQTWKDNYDAALKILAVLAPPGFTEAFEDKAFKEYLAA